MARRAGAVVKRSVTIAGHRTSLTLEPAFWQALQRIARARGSSVSRLVLEIDAAGGEPGSRNLSSAVRVFVLEAVARGEDRG